MTQSQLAEVHPLMRPWMLVFVSLALAGCGSPQPSVAVRPDVKPRSGYPIVSPVYAHRRDRVLAACVMACDLYCHDAAESVDREAGTLRVFDRNAWTGSVTLSVWLIDLGDGCTRMDMEASEAPDFIGDEIQLQRKRMREFADHVARHLTALELIQPVQPPTTVD